nr:integrase, catalytic region, zinc finger, CCHC-type, peptidase aspartic, catalytic [Tanacetum cinerariifolium]
SSNLDSRCSKHMTGQRSQLVNFIDKFFGIVRFGNDHIAKITGYGNYQIGNITILSEDLGKLKPKEDIGIFIGYAPTKKTYRIYNTRTRQIMETIHVDFDEVTTMASEQSSLGFSLNEMTPGIINSGLVKNPPSTTPYVPPTKKD